MPQRAELRAKLAELWPELRIVAECGDGLTALEASEQRRPQVAFLDIRMPGVSGLEVARAVGAQCQVIFTTAYEGYALRAFDDGTVDYLLKTDSARPARAGRRHVSSDRFERRASGRHGRADRYRPSETAAAAHRDHPLEYGKPRQRHPHVPDRGDILVLPGSGQVHARRDGAG